MRTLETTLALLALLGSHSLAAQEPSPTEPVAPVTPPVTPAEPAAPRSAPVEAPRTSSPVVEPATPQATPVASPPAAPASEVVYIGGPPLIDGRYPVSSGGASFPLGLNLDALKLEGHLSIYSQYVLSLRSDAGESDWFHEFELPRGHARIDAQYEDARARVLVEAVRSASEGSLLGVAGDSFVMRMREAWGSYTAWDVLEARLGLVPTMTIGPVEGLWGMRQLNATGIERTNLHVAADLGGTIRGLFPEGYGWVGVGAYNGEGYAQRELNRGKNVELAAVVHPFAFEESTKPITVQLSYVAGSRGTSLGRSDRLTASLGWMGDMFRGGASFTYAWGIDEQPDTTALMGEAFLRVMPIPKLSLGASALTFLRDTSRTDDYQVAITGGGGYFFVDPLGLFLAVDGLLQGAESEQANTPRDDVRFRLVGALEF